MNPAISAIGGSTIRALHARRKPTSIDLGLGQPTLPPEMAYFERATEWTREHGCKYSTNIGFEDLRELIAARYAYPNLTNASNVCVTTGSQEAVYLALKTLLDPAHDEILLVEPAFPVYAKIAQVEGIALRAVTMDPASDCAFDAERILDAVGPHTRLIALCSPANPTGRVISRAAVERISSALLARSGPPVYVLHDEIYRELVYTDDAGEFGKVYPYTVAINSISKSNAMTGLRLGWIMAPEDVMPDLVKMHGWTTSCASTYAQRVAFEIFAAGDLTSHRAWYAAQRDGALAAARAEGLRVIRPEGAFYLCLDTGVENTMEFAEALIDERDVVAIPGDIFSPSLRGWLRTSFVGPLDDIRRGYQRIAEFATTHRPAKAEAVR